MSSLKTLSSAPSSNYPGDSVWDAKVTSDSWIVDNGAAVAQATYPVLYSQVGLISDGNVNSTWTTRTSGTAQTIYSLTYGNSLYVYAGGNGVLGTSTDAITWTARTSGTASAIRALTYANGLYVGVGIGGDARTSTDAITWTARTSGTASNINALTYGNNLFVYGGSGGGTLGTAAQFTYDATTNFELPTTSATLSGMVLGIKT
jgi:hypothetical protein